MSQDTDSTKCWSSKNKLQWSDFKGQIVKSEIESGTKATCPHKLIAIPSRKNGILNYRVVLVFLKREAWTTDTSKYLLAHEQLHFDIGELYARKLRRAIREMHQQNATVETYRHTIEKLITEESLKQDEYDEKTVHGIIVESQQKWVKKICTDLDSLKEFASTAEDCNTKK